MAEAPTARKGSGFSTYGEGMPGDTDSVTKKNKKGGVISMYRVSGDLKP